MATKKQTNYTEYESAFLDKKLKEIEAYLESIDIGKLTDRFVKKGSRDILTAKKEDQRKDYFAALKEYAELAKMARDLRVVEETKREVRGDQNLTPLEEGLL